jgi:5-methyltetrahydrofolate--homocysteine methyltransferase
MNEILDKISKAVIRGDPDSISMLTELALSKGLTAEDILDKALMPGMDYVGVEFRKAKMFVPDVIFAARAMQVSMDILTPLLVEAGAEMAGKVVMGTVQGDLHDIGKNLVCIMMEGAGFEVIDLGNDVATEAFVEAVKKEKPDILGMSAMLTTTMPAMGRTIEALEEAALRDSVKIMVGGVTVTADFAQEIGADGYASNAPAAADMAKQIVGI